MESKSTRNKRLQLLLKEDVRIDTDASLQP
jgi:hypothetical protein